MLKQMAADKIASRMIPAALPQNLAPAWQSGGTWHAYKGRPAAPAKAPPPPPKQAPAPTPSQGAPKPAEPKPAGPGKEGQ